jgi:hypothetical protein
MLLAAQIKFNSLSPAYSFLCFFGGGVGVGGDIDIGGGADGVRGDRSCSF